MIALIHASESKSDPVNVVKIMLDSKVGDKAIEMVDNFNNFPLHVASKLQHIPLSLSLVF